ncbi:HprK-related kinase A [Thiohalocapsa halophila]
MRLADSTVSTEAGLQHLGYRIGPFAIQLHTPLRQVAELVRWSYADAQCLEPDTAAVQFNVRIERGPLRRRLLKPQAIFHLENDTPFQPFPADHAFPLLEWGLNWAIALRAQQFLMLHAAVLERDGRALLLPAVPGSGKSTLAAALTLRGWRLLSDEFGLVDPQTLAVVPVPRAIPLKNASIGVIRAFSPLAELGPVFPKTRKGDVAHLRPPGESLLRDREAAYPAWIVFPRYAAGAKLQRQALTRGHAFHRLSQNSFNYRLLGATGFAALTALVQRCHCWRAEYGDLDEIVAAVDKLPSPLR